MEGQGKSRKTTLHSQVQMACIALAGGQWPTKSKPGKGSTRTDCLGTLKIDGSGSTIRGQVRSGIGV